MEEATPATDDRHPAAEETGLRAAVRKRARQRLRRAQSLVEHSSDILFIVDSAGNPIYVSPAAGRILGYAQDRPLGQSTLDLLHPEDASHTAEMLQLVMSASTGEDESLLVRTRTVDGGYRVLNLRAKSLLHDPDVEGVLVSARDVTDQMRAEADLRRSENRFRNLVQNSSDMIIVIDADATVSYVSPASELIFGRPESEMLGTGALDFIHPDDVHLAAKGLENTMVRGGTRAPIAIRARHADGRWVDVEVVSNNLLDDDEVRGVVINVRDVSERRRMEVQLAKAQQLLIDAFDQAAVGMALIDLDGRYTRVNRAMCEMLGYEEDELLGRSHELSSCTDDTETPGDRLREALSRGLDTYHLERRYRHRDGHLVWASVGVTIVRDDAGNAQYLVSQAIDVTERKELEQRLEYEAVHDPLTGLPTRPLLFDRLDQALAAARRRKLQVAVLFVDLDDFKVVNDSLGHVAGDEVLVGIARRLREAVREVDTPARFGGDEFVVICPDVDGIADAVGIAERIQASFESGIPVAGKTVRIYASIGIAIADGSAAGDALLSEADSATYGAKSRGGAAWELAATLNGRPPE